MGSEKYRTIEEVESLFCPPVVVISTVVGRGMYSLGEALKERFISLGDVSHFAVEEFAAKEIVREDLERYKWISNNHSWLLHLAYSTSLIYLRKYLREIFFKSMDVASLELKLKTLKPKTVICISHRPAFWLSVLKRRTGMNFDLWGVLGEYGHNYGWKYIFWDQMKGYLSPVEPNRLHFSIPEQVKYVRFILPAKKEYYELAHSPAPKNSVLLVCGYWGQGPLFEMLDNLLKEFPTLTVHCVCAENKDVLERASLVFEGVERVKLYGILPSLLPLMKECGAVITKPGIATILECHAARRKLFLLKGMPVAEDNNARYAIEYFGAEWYNLERFRRWLESNPRESFPEG